MLFAPHGLAKIESQQRSAAISWLLHSPNALTPRADVDSMRRVIFSHSALVAIRPSLDGIAIRHSLLLEFEKGSSPVPCLSSVRCPYNGLLNYYEIDFLSGSV